MHLKRLVWPANRLHRLAVVVAGCLVLYTLLGFFLLPRIIQHVAVSTLSEQLHRQASIKGVRFNPYLLSCELSGLSIAKQSGQGSWIALDRLLVNLQASSLFKQALVVSQLTIDHPSLSITRNADQSYNFSDLFRPQTASGQEEEGKPEPFRFSVNNIQIFSGAVEFIDKPAQTRHRISGLSFSLPTLSNFPYAVETFVEPHFAAEVNNMSVELGGRTKPFAKSRQSRLELKIDALSLPYYLGYLPGKRNFGLAGGTLSTDLRLTYAAPSQEAPYLKLEGSMELNDLRVNLGKEQEDAFCSIPRLSIEVGPGNLLSGDLHLTEVRVQEPEISLVRGSNQRLLLPGIETGAGRPEKEELSEAEPQSEGFLSLAVDRFQLESGRISFTDQSTSPGFSTSLHPVRVSLTDLRTDSREPSAFSLDMRTGKGEALAVNGSLSLHPVSFAAEAKLSKLQLNRYAPYYGPYFKGAINQGSCDVATEIHFKQGREAEFRLENVSLGLKDLSLSDVQGQKAVALPSLSLQKGRVSLKDRKIALGSVVLEQGDFRIERSPESGLNLAAMAGTGSREPSPGEEDNAPPEPWGFRLNELRIDGCRTAFIDETLASPLQVTASDISCRLENLSNAKGQKGELDLSLRLEKQGRLQAKGSFGLSPLQGSLGLGLEGLDLKAFAPLLSKYASLTLRQGSLDTKGQLEIKASVREETPSISFAGQTRLRGLKVSEAGQQADFLSWKQLSLDGIAFETGTPSLRIEKMELAGLNAELLILPDGSLNVQRILKTQAAEQADSAPRGQAGQGQAVLAVDQLRLSQGTVQFIDRSVSPPFQSTLSDLQCNIRGLSNQKEAAEISAQANLGSNAPFRVEGKANLMGERFFTEMKLHLANLALSPFSPYSGKYIGYAISKGKFNLDSRLRIEGQELNSEHSLLLDQFTLGEKVKSPDAVNAPVKLGIALLKNRSGEIHIDKSVSGDLSDPEFTIGDLVMRVFVNALVKAAASPFAILGSMFGGGEDINVVLFSPGQASLDQEAGEKMQKLGKALYERPGLNVDVLGRADVSKDRAALREMRFQSLLREQKYLDLEKKEQAESDLEDMRILQEEYLDYLWKAYKAAPMEKPKNALGLTKKLPPQELEQRLREHISISEDDLRQLAAERAQNVMNILRQAGPVDPERLFLQNPQLGTDAGDAFIRAELRVH